MVLNCSARNHSIGNAQLQVGLLSLDALENDVLASLHTPEFSMRRFREIA
ncbi:hypothetical protein BN2475_1290024 [Paraburkholderia ribeironis]|uniref:Uncharacterized protein n=1 Tax=Paraburkholderia ribeironis TaxID=1247936 RepID=A0A1N7SPD6_9BURK|nr:hypothetical protein BN2475_1290024 [Paraburkholderia ribeironis]